jgi:hypothetical protein
VFLILRGRGRFCCVFWVQCALHVVCVFRLGGIFLKVRVVRLSTWGYFLAAVYMFERAHQPLSLLLGWVNPIWHPLIKEHGKEYFKAKSILPHPAPNNKKAARAPNTDPFNTAYAHSHASSQATTAAAAAPSRAAATKVDAPSQTYTLRPRNNPR